MVPPKPPRSHHRRRYSFRNLCVSTTRATFCVSSVMKFAYFCVICYAKYQSMVIHSHTGQFVYTEFNRNMVNAFVRSKLFARIFLSLWRKNGNNLRVSSIANRDHVFLRDLSRLHSLTAARFSADKMCVPEDLLDYCKEMVKQETKTATNIVCIPARDRWASFGWIWYLKKFGH